MEISTAQLYERLSVSAKELRKFCVQSHIKQLAFFGSVLRNDFREDSDIDILIRLATDSNIDLLDFVGLEYQLEDLFHRDVDLLTWNAVEKSHNWIRRHAILDSAKLIYDSRRILPD